MRAAYKALSGKQRMGSAPLQRLLKGRSPKSQAALRPVLLTGARGVGRFPPGARGLCMALGRVASASSEGLGRQCRSAGPFTGGMHRSV